MTEAIEQPDSAAEEPAIPATDPPVEATPPEERVAYSDLYAGIYGGVLDAFKVNGGRAQGTALKPYEMKAADIALVLTQIAISASYRTP